MNKISIEEFYSYKNLYKCSKSEQFKSLNDFIFTNKNNLNTKIQFSGINQVVPQYIKDKYKKCIVPKQGGKSLIVKIRDIFTKVSKSNFKEMLDEFHNYDLEFVVNDIVQIIFDFCTDLIYLVDIYIYFIKDFNERYPLSFSTLKNKIIKTTMEINNNEKGKRLETNNIILIAKMFNHSLLLLDDIKLILNYYENIIVQKIDLYLHFFKNVDISLFSEEDRDRYYTYLDEISYDIRFEKRIGTTIGILLDEKNW